MILTLLAQIKNPVVKTLENANPDDAPGLFSKLIASLVAIMLVGASIWTLWQLLRGGLAWISSSGDKGKLETAQGIIRNAVIGLIITFSCWAFYLLIIRFLGLTSGEGFNFTLPSLL